MAIYATGDTHGSQSHGMYSIDGFMHRLNTTSFLEQKQLRKEDYVIICGDFGGIWDVDLLRVRESPAEKAGLDWLEQKSFTTLFIPGNHENYDRLTGCCDDHIANTAIANIERKRRREEKRQKLLHS